MLNTKQYYIEFLTCMIMYTIAVFFSVWYVINHEGSAWRAWVALLPILPAILATIAVIRALKKMDELQQKIQLISFAISFAIVGLSTFTYGFLENVGFPSIPLIWIFPFMIVTWGITTQIVSRNF